MTKSSIGQVARNNDGQIYITQKVMGVDPKEISDAVKEAKKATALPINDKIDKVTQQIAALQEATEKLTSIQASTSLLAHRFHLFASEKTTNIYNTKQLDVSTNDGTPYQSIALITPFENANLGSFTLSINQIASTDILKTTVNVNDLSTPLGRTGTLSLGTTFPDSVQNFTVTADMSLAAIQTLLNSKTDQTHVYAEVAFISPGVYEFKLKGNALSEAIVLSDDNTGLQAGLGFTKPAGSVLAGSLQATTQDTPLNYQGNLVIGVGQGGNSQSVNITTDMSLKDIVSAINTASGSTTVTADYDLVYDTPQVADAEDNMPNKVYQLRLKTQNPVDTVYATGSDPLFKNLGLSSPLTDYNSLASLLTCDGTNFKRNDNTITDVVQGVTIDLKGASSTTILKASITTDKTNVLNTLQDFITSYNDLKTFYDAQIALDMTDPKKPKASKTAILLNNNTFKQACTSLSTILSSSIPGLDNNINTMDALGLALEKGTGKLQLKDMNKFTDLLDKNYTGFMNILGNQATNTNSDFKIGNITSFLSNSLSNVPITVTYARDAEGSETASFTINGTVINASVKNGIITGTQNNAYQGLEGLQFMYLLTLNPSESVSTTISLTQGLCARLDCAITRTIVNDPLMNKKGTFVTEVENLNTTERSEKGKIEKINEQAEKEAARSYRQMESVSQAQQKYYQIHSMLKSFNKAGQS